MSQFAVLRSNDIVGFVEDDNKQILTIFLSNGSCCVILYSTVHETLQAYGVEDLDELFGNEVWANDNGQISFGQGPILTNTNVEEPKLVPYSKVVDELCGRKKKKF